MEIKVGQIVSIDCENKSLDVCVLSIIANVSDKGFMQSGDRLDSVDYTDFNITDNMHNENHIIVFDHPETDYKWAHLYQIRIKK